jgi:hypothetical protein
MKPEDKTMKIRALLLGGLVAAAAPAVAQGDFPFGEIPGLDVEPTVEIDLNPTMMGFLSEAAKGAEGEAAAALSGSRTYACASTKASATTFSTC